MNNLALQQKDTVYIWHSKVGCTGKQLIRLIVGRTGEASVSTTDFCVKYNSVTLILASNSNPSSVHSFAVYAYCFWLEWRLFRWYSTLHVDCILFLHVIDSIYLLLRVLCSTVMVSSGSTGRKCHGLCPTCLSRSWTIKLLFRKWKQHCHWGNDFHQRIIWCSRL